MTKLQCYSNSFIQHRVTYTCVCRTRGITNTDVDVDVERFQLTLVLATCGGCEGSKAVQDDVFLVKWTYEPLTWNQFRVTLLCVIKDFKKIFVSPQTNFVSWPTRLGRFQGWKKIHYVVPKLQHLSGLRVQIHKLTHARAHTHTAFVLPQLFPGLVGGRGGRATGVRQKNSRPFTFLPQPSLFRPFSSLPQHTAAPHSATLWRMTAA